MSGTASAAILVTGMLITGCSNSLWSKFQDKQCVANCGDPDPARRQNFEQPVWQTLNMFIGEASCLIAFYLIQYATGRSSWSSSQINHRNNKGYTSIPRDSTDETSQPLFQDEDHGREGGSESEANNAQTGGLSSSTLSDQLIQPAHLKIRSSPTVSSTPLAVHGPVPPPLTNALEPDLITNQHEPTVPRLIGLQKLVFWLPTMFDICGTTLMNAGLLFVPVSVFQMIRGALPIWVGLFSIVFLNRHLTREKWISLTIITSGVALVGYAGSLQPQSQPKEVQADPSKSFEHGDDPGAKVVLGLFLIFFAQLFTASQFVIEEKIMTKYEVPPLEAVGLEGIFGLLTTLICIPILHIFIGSLPENRGGYFDASTEFTQVLNNPSIIYSSIAIAISIGLFNFCGLAVTKSISATARSVIDTCRSIGIWVFSLAIGWEEFSFLQLIGFIILVVGTFFFNQIITYPVWFKKFIGSLPVHAELPRRVD